MTRIPELLGTAYDAPAALPASLSDTAKRSTILRRLADAEAVGDDGVARLMKWELGILDLIIAPADDLSPYRGGSYDDYAAHYGLTPESAEYARERALETHDVILRMYYLEFVFVRSAPTGREWIVLQRRMLETYREFINQCIRAATQGSDDLVGVYIDQALRVARRLLGRPGVLQPGERVTWAEWIIQLAEQSRSLPVKDPQWVAQQRHRWVADYLSVLALLPAEAVTLGARARAQALLDDAAQYYQSTPLNADFESLVAVVDADLRKQWGETGTHERMVRRNYSALVRRAEFHRETGNGLLTGHFIREARRLVEEHRQYFTAADIAALHRAEHVALLHAVDAGEFAEIRVPYEIPRENMDLTGDTAEDTVDALVKHATAHVPDWKKLATQLHAASADAPLRTLFGHTVIGHGKVVGESASPDDSLALDVERFALFEAGLAGEAISFTIIQAGSRVSLCPEQLLVPLMSLQLDEGTTRLLTYGFERLLAQDFIGAAHVLILRVEDVLRQHLRSLGVDTAEFKGDVGDGTSRTDDAPLGALLRQTLPDCRTVAQYLGDDLWNLLDSVLNSQTGLNLRNIFAHGLARPGHCSASNTGLAVSLMYALSSVCTPSNDAH